MRREPVGKRWLILVAAALLAAGCSDDAGGGEPAASTTSEVGQSAVDPVLDALPIVGQIDAAIAALEAELGATQQYFEINATARLVNLFVSLNNGAVAQPWLYLEGELSSGEGTAAGGGTFAASDLDFDPATVLSRVAEELPGATIQSFYVNGDGNGNVQYGLLVTSAQGGGLDVLVGPDGEIKAVDPVS